MLKIGIIGGGASGIMAALSAYDTNTEVTIFEKKDRIGKKLLVTGNGRCNFTNLNLSSSYYYCEDTNFITNALDTFGNTDLINFFMGLGLLVKEKNGYCYPASEQASSVLDVLRIALNEKNIIIKTEIEITDISKTTGGYLLKTSLGEEMLYDRVIISAGGRSGLSKNEKCNSHDLCKKLGLKVTKLYPALTQIKCEGFNFKAISGVRQECDLFVNVDNETTMKQHGEVLFNDTGLSGIVAFQVSHHVGTMLDIKKHPAITLDLLPNVSEEALKQFVITKKLLYPSISLEDFFTGFLNKKLNIEIIKQFGLRPSDKISDIDENTLIELSLVMKCFTVSATGTGTFEQSQVTGGGVDINQVNANFEVIDSPGLFITGELLDVDGICGGYNLQWAFTTGYIAGKQAAKMVK